MSTIPLPDLLHGQERATPDHALLEELLGLAFLGSNETARIHRNLGDAPLETSTWDADLYASEIFLEEFVAGFSRLRFGGRRYNAHGEFLARVLGNPPGDLETIRFRQEILRELESDDDIRVHTEKLYQELIYLLDLIKSAHTQRSVDNTPDRLRVLAQCATVIEMMESDFGSCSSGLRRIHEAGAAIKKTRQYRILSDLLSFEDDLASVRLSMRLGADGRIKNLQIDEFEEARDNRFYKRPLTRWREMASLFWRGYPMSAREVVNRVIVDVYLKNAPALAQVSLLVGHLEVYLTARSFADTARQRGLDVSLAEVTETGPLRYDRLFNPLLLAQDESPVPCDLSLETSASVCVVTGPNSGGKTRLLQGVGLSQLLAQNGLYVPASSAEVPMVQGEFASLVQSDRADQVEGRLGTELLRIRSLFEHIRPNSMVLLDELCSGTNPSEAAEIVLMVLRLLVQLSPRAFITTHFLDLARELAANGSVEATHFLQVQMEGETSTYQFIDGVANTSMATETARRLGVDFERLTEEINARLARQESAVGADSVEAGERS
ncbi:MAG: DNA mismatch repair protein [Acidobacteria bacterium]|nr:DNA mismatch repair protein [Acidobacteriota bacterium]